MKNYLLSYCVLFSVAFADSFALFAIKRRFNEVGNIDFSSFSNFLSYMITYLKSPLSKIAILLYVIAPVLGFYVFSKLDLTIAYPLLIALHIFFIIFFGGLFLHETINWNKIVSSVLVILAAVILYQNK